jgi:type II secretion system protein H
MKWIPSSGDERNAFTLIELMIVILLIGVLTAVIVPEMKGSYQGALLRAASRELVSAIQVASSRSVSFGKEHRLRLNRTDGKYVVEKQVGRRGADTYVPLRDIPGGEGEWDARIKVEVRKGGGFSADSNNDIAVVDAGETASEDSISFFPDGTAERVEIVLQDRDHFRLALRIDPVTAHARVVELPPE